MSVSGEKPEGTKKVGGDILTNPPTVPKPPEEDSFLDWQGALPNQLGIRTLWFQTLFSLLSQTDHVPCPYLVRSLLEEIRVQDPSGTESSYPYFLTQALQERRHFDPCLAEAFENLQPFGNEALVGAMGYLLTRLGESLDLPMLEIAPGELRHFFQQAATQESPVASPAPWPPWGKHTLERLLRPCLSLEATDLSLLTSGVGQWSASDRQWIREVDAAKKWFLKWRKKAPMLPHWGSQLVVETKGAKSYHQQGGLETLVSRGPLENLLPSELVWTNEPGDLFPWKWTQGELLYFGREQATALRPNLCWNLHWDVSVLDWQFWAEGCAGRMSAMALGWVLSVLEAVHQDRGAWNIQARWNLMDRKGKTWESSLSRMRHVVGMATPYHSTWKQKGEDSEDILEKGQFTHQCHFQIGDGFADGMGIHPMGIHLHPQKGISGAPSLALGLVGQPQTVEEWLDWDERVMLELGQYWIGNENGNGEWHDQAKKTT